VTTAAYDQSARLDSFAALAELVRLPVPA
jgi:hypothetical protein